MALPSFTPSPLCAVFACIHTTGCEAYSFTTDEYGIFNVRTNVGACRTREEGGGGGSSGTNKSRVASEGYIYIYKLFLTLPRQRFEPRVFGFEFRLCNY